MEDVSSNENIEDQEDIEDVSSNMEIPEHIPDDLHSTNAYVYTTETGDYNSLDYSAAFADIQNLLKFQIAVIIGFLLVVSFIIGWKHD